MLTMVCTRVGKGVYLHYKKEMMPWGVINSLRIHALAMDHEPH